MARKKSYITFETKEEFDKVLEQFEKAEYDRGVDAGMALAFSYIWESYDMLCEKIGPEAIANGEYIAKKRMADEMLTGKKHFTYQQQKSLDTHGSIIEMQKVFKEYSKTIKSDDSEEKAPEQKEEES